jgi:hypothetical protein
MKRWILPFLGLLLLLGCGDEITNNYFAPSQVVNFPGPTTGASPSPSPGAGAVRSVRIGEFGEVCPQGVGPPAETVPRQVRVGCTSAITCTPLDAQGREIPNATPPRLDSFNVVSGNQHVIVDAFDDNAYNLSVFGLSAGVATFVCRVEGVSSDPWPLTVVP